MSSLRRACSVLCCVLPNRWLGTTPALYAASKIARGLSGRRAARRTISANSRYESTIAFALCLYWYRGGSSDASHQPSSILHARPRILKSLAYSSAPASLSSSSSTAIPNDIRSPASSLSLLSRPASSSASMSGRSRSVSKP